MDGVLVLRRRWRLTLALVTTATSEYLRHRIVADTLGSGGICSTNGVLIARRLSRDL